ncbi:dihydrolipoamide acetyltransferase component of pyruvate dehydrogenase complex [Saccharopolyspora subtropica]|uniref:Dihydrolipoamide acetyltransferase component of pyruvate dehydrogenase complex n=1 Tax=Saccharopolyspora thermophila TaxID=89367 RepID=A0A917NK09_9PSEU|nr:2-oxo acid dehydrogenase subunit E2 [Saccharopolyspora subtropica]GGJ06929.1 dihydrolipoamide acetyltransferase component of pyruvate dehydrogenase complex [Saccharopolyspora subtropica]
MSKINLIEVPKWGLSMEEGTITRWLVAEGTRFRKGDPICEVETSKITNEMEAPFDGVLRRVVAREGETLPVGAPMAVSAEEDVADSEIDAFLSQRVPTADRAAEAPAQHVPAPEPGPAHPPASPASAPAPAGTTVIPEVLQGTVNGDVLATPRAVRFATEQGIDLAKIPGSGRLGRVSLEDVHNAIHDAGGSVAAPPAPRRTAPRSTQDDSCVDATPVARRLAANLGINLHDCRATGSRGRVCVADVREAQRKFNPDVSTAAPDGSSTATPGAGSPAFESVPLSSMRRAIGQRLQASKQNSPHFRLSVDLEIDDLLALRKQINATVAAVKLSVNDFVVKACASALRAVPEVNVQFDEESQSVLQHSAADISVAVALPSGLITPIVRGADTKSLAEISESVRSLVTKAKAGTLKPDEFQGGTFTVSNLGMYGVREFDAIINPPQAAILAVGAGEQRAVVRDGQLVARTLVTATLSCDHRVIDGALGARFLQELKRFVESPALMLV